MNGAELIFFLRRIWRQRAYLVFLPLACGVIPFLADHFSIIFIEKGAELIAFKGLYSVFIFIIHSLRYIFIFFSVIAVIDGLFKKNITQFTTMAWVLALFFLSSNIIGHCHNYAIREISLINLDHNEKRYLTDINNSKDGYGGDLRFTEVDREMNDGVSKKGKLLVWDLERGDPGQWLLVFDESDEVEKPESNQRYIGRYCAVSNGVGQKNTCILKGKNPDPITIGFRPEIVITLKSHFYLVYIDNRSEF